MRALTAATLAALLALAPAAHLTPAAAQQPPPPPPNPAAAPSAAPTGVGVTPADDGLLVTFTPSADTEVTSHAIDYGVSSSFADAQRLTIADGDLSAQLIADLTAGTTYYVRVGAVKPGVTDPIWSATASAAPLAAAAATVTGVTAVSTNDGEITVNWNAVTGASGYQIYWTTLDSPVAGAGTPDPIAAAPKTVTDGTTTTATLTGADGITASQRYRVWVLATETAKAHSAVSTPADVTAGPALEWLTAISLSGTQHTNTVELQWNPVPGATDYEIAVQDGGQGTFVLLSTVDAATSVWRDVAAGPASSPNVYRVSARHTNDDGTLRTGSSIDTPGAPGFPGVATLTATSVPTAPTTLRVTWSQVPEGANSATVTGYRVQHRTVDGVFGAPTTVTGADTTTHLITGLALGTEYVVRVFPAYSLGASIANPAYGAILQGTVSTPSPPADVTATPTGGGLLVTFTPSGDDVVSHSIQHSTDSAFASPTSQAVGTNGLGSYLIGGLTAGSAYWVRVGAIRRVGPILWSDAVSAAPLATAAATVAGVAAVSNADSEITVSWNEVAGASGYKVFWSVLSSASGGTAGLIGDSAPKTVTGGTTTTTTLTGADGIAASQHYRVWVLATEAAKADSAIGTPADVTTKPALEWLTVVSLNGTQHLNTVELQWSPVPGAASYEIAVQDGGEDAFMVLHTVDAPANAPATSWRDINAGPTQVPNVYRVSARHANADGTLRTGSSIEAAGSPGQPGVPSLTVSQVASDPEALDLAWQAVGARATAATVVGYRVQYRTDSGQLGPPITVAGADTLTYRLTGLMPNTRYTVRVYPEYRLTPTTTNPSFGAPSEEPATTAGFEVTITRVAGVSVMHGSAPWSLMGLRVTWEQVPDVQGYRVEWKRSDQAEYPPSQSFLSNQPMGSNYLITREGRVRDQTRLAGNTEYTIKVTPYAFVPGLTRTVDLAAFSANVTTYLTFPWAVVTGVVGDNEALKVYWPPVEGAHSYRIQWRLATETEFNTGQIVAQPSDLTGVTELTYDVSGLESEVYLFRVTVRKADDSGMPVDDNYLEDYARPDNYELPIIAPVTFPNPPNQNIIFVNGRRALDAQGFAWHLGIVGEPYSQLNYNPDVELYSGNTLQVDRQLPEFAIGVEVKVRGASLYTETLADVTPSQVRVKGPFSETTATFGETPAARATIGTITVSPVQTDNTALLVQWSSVAEAFDYDVEWKQSTAANYATDDRHKVRSTATARTEQLRLTGLMPGTTYDVRVSPVFRGAFTSETVGTPGTGQGTTVSTPSFPSLSVLAGGGATPNLMVSWKC